MAALRARMASMREQRFSVGKAEGPRPWRWAGTQKHRRRPHQGQAGRPRRRVRPGGQARRARDVRRPARVRSRSSGGRSMTNGRSSAAAASTTGSARADNYIRPGHGHARASRGGASSEHQGDGAKCGRMIDRAPSPGRLAVTNALAALRLLPVSDRDKDVEILALRHQIMVLQRQLDADTRVRFAPEDRAFLAALLTSLPREIPHRLRLLVHPRSHTAPGPGEPWLGHRRVHWRARHTRHQGRTIHSMGDPQATRP